MITQYTITNSAWTAISTVGQSGTCWVEKTLKGGNSLRLYHSNIGVPGLDKITHGYPMWRPNKNFDAVQLVPDDSVDVFYAIAEGEGSEFLLTVDVI